MAAQRHLAEVLLGLEVNANGAALPTLRIHSLPRGSEPTSSSLLTDHDMSPCLMTGLISFHGRQIDQQILTLLTAVTKQTKEITVCNLAWSNSKAN